LVFVKCQNVTLKKEPWFNKNLPFKVLRASTMETLNFEVLNGSHIDTSLFIIF